MARQRLEARESRAIILDAVERLMGREGFAAVNTRSVALEAGMKPTLVHYHFDTTENLLTEAYRRSASRSEEVLLKILASDRPLRALWLYNSDPVRTALATQFMALAGHRPELREEIGANVERFRRLQEQVLQHAVDPEKLKTRNLNPASVSMLIAAIGRAFVLEMSIGISAGHDDLRFWAEQLIEDLEPLAE